MDDQRNNEGGIVAVVLIVALLALLVLAGGATVGLWVVRSAHVQEPAATVVYETQTVPVTDEQATPPQETEPEAK